MKQTHPLVAAVLAITSLAQLASAQPIHPSTTPQDVTSLQSYLQVRADHTDDLLNISHGLEKRSDQGQGGRLPADHVKEYSSVLGKMEIANSGRLKRLMLADAQAEGRPLNAVELAKLSEMSQRNQRTRQEISILDRSVAAQNAWTRYHGEYQQILNKMRAEGRSPTPDEQSKLNALYTNMQSMSKEGGNADLQFSSLPRVG